ncbi:TPA: hypothetical protein ACX3EK_003329 [Vibrio parahaemolyticus]|uniref:hypothetical protein n=1 Tax=Vibrio parahaemolyticus TaxID=670 RepID=UPI00084A4050|nr:hypothetical protein [Vibrio parahaemolyticus]MBO0167118.1 hypothetical protein [Vibrio parahaemolyticus]MDF4752522.1 hypothetical protein [Vibrio parahaemolyticus]MDF4778636.1 hypothetical protein [Vibrio parahaemolyticus]MDF4786607.1 hypothetical protein [Vibrio parahaemolyticus]MDF4794479.1 hypothetical protein [Vibrio parahaemolyticus]
MQFTKISTALTTEQSIVAYSAKAARIREEIEQQKSQRQPCHNYREIDVHQDGSTRTFTQKCVDQDLEPCPACKHNQFLSSDIKNLKSQLHKVNVSIDRHCKGLDVDYTCDVVASNYTPLISIPVRGYVNEADSLIAILKVLDIDYTDQRLIKLTYGEPEDLAELLYDHEPILADKCKEMGVIRFVDYILPIIRECSTEIQDNILFVNKLISRISN